MNAARRQSREPWTGPDGLLPMAAMGFFLFGMAVMAAFPGEVHAFLRGLLS